MSSIVRARIGQKAPDFNCEAVIDSLIESVSLSTYIRAPSSPSVLNPWLILVFVPSAFAFVCKGEVHAFQDCHGEFHNRNCSVVFVSTDTKHALWHWARVPSGLGGLGRTDIPLLSDPSHKMSKDYGVLIEDKGESVRLRGTFIVDGEGLLQQIVLNDITAEGSVLKVLRLLETSQAVANQSAPSPAERICNTKAADVNSFGSTSMISHKTRPSNRRHRGKSPSTKSGIQRLDLPIPLLSYDNRNQSPRKAAAPRTLVFKSGPSYSVRALPASDTVFSAPKPGVQQLLHGPTDDRKMGAGITDDHLTAAPGVSMPEPQSRPCLLIRHNTYQTQCGSHVVLDFADPPAGPSISPPAAPTVPLLSPSAAYTGGLRVTRSPELPGSRYAAGDQWSPSYTAEVSDTSTHHTESPTRLQASLKAFKKMTAGLRSPWFENGPKRGVDAETQGYFG